jgi:hypothetical protein
METPRVKTHLGASQYGPGSNRRRRALQTPALPLSYRPTLIRWNVGRKSLDPFSCFAAPSMAARHLEEQTFFKGKPWESPDSKRD